GVCYGEGKGKEFVSRSETSLSSEGRGINPISSLLLFFCITMTGPAPATFLYKPQKGALELPAQLLKQLQPHLSERAFGALRKPDQRSRVTAAQGLKLVARILPLEQGSCAFPCLFGKALGALGRQGCNRLQTAPGSL
ncbi:UNVERIFIED_CONTAM: hypothetical protein K2H54_058638, partial [Gekko kuhli]